MYFRRNCQIKYIMPEKRKVIVFRIIVSLLSVAILIAAPVMALKNKNGVSAENEMMVMSVWQIDCFEGGKGSRASYLQSAANKFSEDKNTYFNVVQLSSEAARENLKNGNCPDLISYGAGICGIESYITDSKSFYTWAYGGYCLLSIAEADNFESVTKENTVINIGTENLSAAAALFYGLNGAATERPTGAYVKLINGDYKYLLGTQRDIFKLKTRGVQFSVKPLTEFNDLYQNISITTSEPAKKAIARNFIDYLLFESDEIVKLGLMYQGKTLYEDEMRAMEGLEYQNKIISPLSESVRGELNSAIANNDLKKLKNLCI